MRKLIFIFALVVPFVFCNLVSAAPVELNQEYFYYVESDDSVSVTESNGALIFNINEPDQWVWGTADGRYDFNSENLTIRLNYNQYFADRIGDDLITEMRIGLTANGTNEMVKITRGYTNAGHYYQAWHWDQQQSQSPVWSNRIPADDDNGSGQFVIEKTGNTVALYFNGVNNNDPWIYNVGFVSGFKFSIETHIYGGQGSFSVEASNLDIEPPPLLSPNFLFQQFDVFLRTQYYGIGLDPSNNGSRMILAAYVDDPNVQVYMEGSPDSQAPILLPQLPAWDSFIQYTYSIGVPSGPGWEGRLYTVWFKDANGNTKSLSRAIPAIENFFRILPPVEEVEIKGDAFHPTISWKGIEDADLYRVRLFGLNEDGKVAQANFIENISSQQNVYDPNSNRWSLTYTGGFFETNPDIKIAICIEARETYNSEGYTYLKNKSQYLIAYRASEPPANPVQFFINQRVYEDGQALNRLWFSLQDESNNTIIDDIAAEVKLVDPNGNPVAINDLHFERNRYSFPRYVGNTGQWVYDFDYNWELFHEESEYVGVVPDQLLKGDYRLIITDINGHRYEGQYRFNGFASLPIVRASSFKYKVDNSGNLIWTWEMPYDFYPPFDTSVRAVIKITDQNDRVSYFFSRVPTHLCRLFVPDYVVDKIKEAGEKFEIYVELRTNDNNNRSLSETRELKFNKHHKKGHQRPKH